MRRWRLSSFTCWAFPTRLAVIAAVSCFLLVASDAFADTSTTTQPTQSSGPAQPGAPTTTVPPSIGGVDQDGQTLTASNGTRSGSTSITYSYQWQRCDPAGNTCPAIAGATSQTYTLSSSDIGSTIRVNATAANAAGSGAATSDQTGVVKALPPSNTAAPVSGRARPGAILSASKGDWTGSTPMIYSYQWQRCDPSGNKCSDIVGANGHTYTSTSSDVGQTVRVSVTADNSRLPGGGISSASSTQTAIIDGDWGFANASNAGSVGFLTYFSNSSWQHLVFNQGPNYMGQKGAYERFFVDPAVVSYYNGSSCVPQPTGSGTDAGNLIQSVAVTAYIGETAVIAFSTSPTTAPPSDINMLCAADYLAYDLKNSAWGNLVPYVRGVEPFNEPDRGSGGVSATQAAVYFGDVWQGLWYGNGGAPMTVIAGALVSSDRTYLDGIEWALRYGTNTIPAGGAVNTYAQYANDWSFHDYHDVQAGENARCAFPAGGSCPLTGAWDFWNGVGDYGFPRNNLWITEAEDFNITDGCNTQTYGGKEWLWLWANAPIQHILWYQWPAQGSPWNGALADSSNNPNCAYWTLTN
jgi:hypothetical protein